MEQTLHERTFGNCLIMTNQYEHNGINFHVNIELGKLMTGMGGSYRCHVITAVILGCKQFLYRAEVHSDEETTAAIEDCIKTCKERLGASKVASKVEEGLAEMGFKKQNT